MNGKKEQLGLSSVSHKRSFGGNETNDDTVLDEARDNFAPPGNDPESEIIGVRPTGRQRRIWNVPAFVGTVRRLQIQPESALALRTIDNGNATIEKFNIEDNVPKDRGKFPIRYLQFTYRSAHRMIENYAKLNDAQSKANASLIFQGFRATTKEFCEKRFLPTSWAWECEDINRLPEYLSGYGPVQERPSDQQVPNVQQSASSGNQEGPTDDHNNVSNIQQSNNQMTSSSD